MANIKISELNELTQVDDDDLLVVVDTSANETKKIRAENVGTGGGGGDSTPIGTVEPFSGSTIPNGYLLCDGSAVSRTTYSDLYNVIGTTYGSGDNSTTFNLPNLKGRTIVMQDSLQTEFDTLGETGGEKTHTLTINEMPSHTHTSNAFTTAPGSPGYLPQIDTSIGWGPNAFETNSTGESQAHNILQPYIVLNYIIKAFKTSTTPVKSQVVNDYSTSTNDVYSCNYTNNNDTYSTSEIKTNKRWIDGKPIYRKVYSFTLAQEIPADNNIGVMPTNYSQVIKIYGIANISGGNQTPIPISWNENLDCGVMVQGSNIYVRATWDAFSEATGYMIIEYTKTTD